MPPKKLNRSKPATATKPAKVPTKSITPCLVFNNQCEEALTLYTSVFKGSRIVELTRSDGDGPFPKGAVSNATFELNGTRFVAFDGGPSFTFGQGFSLMALVKTQEEIDTAWERLLEGGGEPSMCGWLVDRFGVSWQIVPEALGKMMANPAKGNFPAMVEAMLQMQKLDLKVLQDAYKQR